MISQRISTLFKGILEKETLSTGYLFYGHSKEALDSTARFIGTWINCLSPQDGPCFQCQSCSLIQSQSSTGFFFIKTETEKMSIDTIRDIYSTVQYGAAEKDKHLVVIVSDCHKLTTEAANAFLKLLEEPPHGVIFILTTQNLLSVLPTIRSRCQILDIPAETVIPQNEDYALSGIIHMDIIQKLETAAALALQKDELKQLILNWLYTCNDLLRSTSQHDVYIKLADACLDALSSLRYNVNVRLLCESLLLSIHTISFDQKHLFQPASETQKIAV